MHKKLVGQFDTNHLYYNHLQIWHRMAGKSEAGMKVAKSLVRISLGIKVWIREMPSAASTVQSSHCKPNIIIIYRLLALMDSISLDLYFAIYFARNAIFREWIGTIRLISLFSLYFRWLQQLFKFLVSVLELLLQLVVIARQRRHAFLQGDPLGYTRCSFWVWPVKIGVAGRNNGYI